MAFRIGFARKDITPAVGGHLYGYHDKIFSTGINDRLFTTAVCFADDTLKILFISCDVCLIQNALSDRIRRLLAEQENLAFDNIFLHATHTHTGPNTAGEIGWGELDTAYCETVFIPQILSAAQQACNSLVCARMGVGTAESRVGINRRQLCTDGRVELGQNPWGTFDPTMTVLSFVNSENKNILNLIHYGAHNTACGTDTLISRDWCGVMVDRLAHESGAVTLYCNGCEGDTGPRLANGQTVGNTQYAMELGGLAGMDAVRAWKNIKTYTEPTLRVRSVCAHIPLQPRIPLQQAKDGYEAFKHYEVNLERQTANFYKNVITSYEEGITESKETDISITLVQLGNTVFVPFAFEMFTEISLRLQAAHPQKNVLCMSNTNGNNSYFPSADQIIRGGYEVQMFKTGNGVQSPVDNADNYLVRAIAEKMEEL